MFTRRYRKSKIGSKSISKRTRKMRGGNIPIYRPATFGMTGGTRGGMRGGMCNGMCGLNGGKRKSRPGKKWTTAIEAAESVLSTTGSINAAKKTLRKQALYNARKLFGSI